MRKERQTREDWKRSGDYFLFNEYKIFYKVFGSGKPLLLIHGYPFNSYDWVDVVNALSESRQVILFDLLGMGYSDKPTDHIYSFEEYSEIVNQLLGFLKVDAVDIFSHDLGVSVVQELLAREAEDKNSFRIRSSAFMNGGLFSDVYRPRLIQRLLSQTPNFIGKFLSKKIKRDAIEKSLFEVFGPSTGPDSSLLDAFWEILNYNDGKSIAYLIGRLVFRKVDYQKRWISSMQVTKVPMCYICGPYDPNSGTRMANRYKEALPESQVYLLSNHIGHWPQIEAPGEVVSAYRKFSDQEKI